MARITTPIKSNDDEWVPLKQLYRELPPEIIGGITYTSLHASVRRDAIPYRLSCHGARAWYIVQRGVLINYLKGLTSV